MRAYGAFGVAVVLDRTGDTPITRLTLQALPPFNGHLFRPDRCAFAAACLEVTR